MQSRQVLILDTQLYLSTQLSCTPSVRAKAHGRRLPLLIRQRFVDVPAEHLKLHSSALHTSAHGQHFLTCTRAKADYQPHNKPYISHSEHMGMLSWLKVNQIRELQTGCRLPQDGAGQALLVQRQAARNHMHANLEFYRMGLVKAKQNTYSACALASTPTVAVIDDIRVIVSLSTCQSMHASMTAQQSMHALLAECGRPACRRRRSSARGRRSPGPPST